MQYVGLETPLDEVEGDPELIAASRQTLDEGVHQIADTVRNSLNFYRMQDSAETVERAVLTGPAVAVPGFAEALAEQLQHPRRRPPSWTRRSDRPDLGRLTVAAGLAVVDAP